MAAGDTERSIGRAGECNSRIELKPASTVEFSRAIPESEQLIPQHASSSFSHSAVSVVTLHDVKVWANNSTLHIHDDVNGTYEKLCLEYVPMDRSRLAQTPLENVCGTTVLFFHLASHNYYHWLIDTLPCMGVLDEAGIDRHSVDQFFILRFMSSFQPVMAEFAGVDTDRVISVEGKPRHLHFEKLVIPIFRADQHMWPNPYLVKYLRSHLAKAVLSGDSASMECPNCERVYITRGDARRSMPNEPELIARLEQKGYLILKAGESSFAEQVRVMTRARQVLAPHGAGLANIVFSRPGARVLEFAGHYITPHFRLLSTYAGHDYKAIAAGLNENGNRLAVTQDADARSLDYMLDVDEVLDQADDYLG